TGSGTTETWPPSGGTYVLHDGKAFKHFYSRQSQMSIENRGTNAGGSPGQMNVTDRFFEFRTPLPATVKVGDRIIDKTNSETFRVALPERRYPNNLQVDTELIR